MKGKYTISVINSGGQAIDITKCEYDKLVMYLTYLLYEYYVVPKAEVYTIEIEKDV